MATPNLYQTAGQQYGVDPLLLQAVAQVESGGTPDPDQAVSSQGAVGRMQFEPATAAEMGVSDPTDPVQAIPGAARYLVQGYQATGGSPAGAVLYYHGGPNTALWGPKTQAYLAKVSARYQALKAGEASTGVALQAAPVAPAPQRPPDAAMAAQWIAAPVASEGAQPAPAPMARPPDAAMAAQWGIGVPDTGSDDSPAVQAALARARENVAAAPAVPAPVVPADPGQQAAALGIPESTIPDSGVTSTPPATALIGGAASLINDATHGLSMGLDRPVNALLGRISPDYGRMENALAPAQQQFDQAHPILSGAAQVAGSLPTFGLGEGALQAIIPSIGAGGVMAGAGNALLGAGRNALLGAGSGYGLSGGDPNAAKTGALAGAAAGPLMGALGYGARGLGALGNFLLPTQGSVNRIAQDAVNGFAGGPLTLDTSTLVPGSQPTLAEAAGNPGISKMQNALTESEPDAANRLYARAQENAAARNTALQGVTGTDADIQSAMMHRSAITPDHLWAAGQTADPMPVVNTIDSILAGPGGGRTAVQQSLAKLKSTLVDDNGKPLTAPPAEYLYNSVRKQIGDQLDKANLADPSGVQSARELLQVRDTLDDTIEQAAPGFKQYLADYSQASQPINAMQWLQGLRLTDAQGNVQLPAVQNALRNYAKQTSATAKGVNPAASVSQDQITSLEGIRDDLLRGQNLNLNKTRGSNTVSNLATQSLMPGGASFIPRIDPRIIGGLLGAGGGHAFGGPETMAVLGGLGEMVGAGLRSVAAAKNAAVRNRLVDMALDPSLYAAPSTGTAGNLLTNLQPYAVPTGILGANRMLAPPQPLNSAP